jgi:hypothetical protein
VTGPGLRLTCHLWDDFKWMENVPGDADGKKDAHDEQQPRRPAVGGTFSELGRRREASHFVRRFDARISHQSPPIGRIEE